MNKIIEQLPEIKLVGITAITSNAAEMNSDTAKIGETMHRFLLEGLQRKIYNRKNPGKVFAVYTNYESNKSGKYILLQHEELAK